MVTTKRYDYVPIEQVQVHPLIQNHRELNESKVVHYQDDTPIQLESRYVNPVAMPDFINQDFSLITPTAYLLEQFKPDEMEHRVSAVMPDATTRELLAMPVAQPCLQLERRTWRRQQVVTWVTLVYPCDRYQLGARYATNEYQLR